MATTKKHRGILIAAVAAFLGAGTVLSGVTLAAFNPFNPQREDTVAAPKPTPANPGRPPIRDPFRPPIRSPFTP